MLSASRVKLNELELADKFVFHGSGYRVSVLEPRQAQTIVDGQIVDDGPPAIYASSLLDYAIFMSLLNKENCPDGARSSCSYEDGRLIFGASQATLDQLNENSVGHVHVLHRSDFSQRGGCEWFATTEQKPVEIIEVRWSDFTCPISIIKHGL
jgi:hypothetical protein